MKIELSKEEILKINTFAEKLDTFKRTKGIKTKKFDKKKSDLKINEEGLQAEYAVAKFLGTDINSWIDYQGDGGIDFIVNNIKIQVKSSAHNNAHLYFNSIEDFEADIAILVITKNDEYRICGFLKREEFKNKYTIRNFGYGNRCCVEQKDLVSINNLKEILNESNSN